MLLHKACTCTYSGGEFLGRAAPWRATRYATLCNARFLARFARYAAFCIARFLARCMFSGHSARPLCLLSGLSAVAFKLAYREALKDSSIKHQLLFRGNLLSFDAKLTV